MLNNNNNPKTEAAKKYTATLVSNFGARSNESLAKQVADVHPVGLALAAEIVAEARNAQAMAAHA